MLTQARLHTVLSYEPHTGDFHWRKGRPGASAGKLCGRTSVYGYREICIDRVLHRAHRLAWLYMTGLWPIKHMDHINRVAADNRWVNLRLCGPRENAGNTIARAISKSGIKGVHFDVGRGKWCAQISAMGVKKNLGRFDDFEAAVNAYRQAEKQVFGEFAATA